jgi:hypothetical protein
VPPHNQGPSLVDPGAAPLTPPMDGSRRVSLYCEDYDGSSLWQRLWGGGGGERHWGSERSAEAWEKRTFEAP